MVTPTGPLGLQKQDVWTNPDKLETRIPKSEIRNKFKSLKSKTPKPTQQQEVGIINI
jgi:hypothetical protein